MEVEPDKTEQRCVAEIFGPAFCRHGDFYHTAYGDISCRTSDVYGYFGTFNFLMGYIMAVTERFWVDFNIGAGIAFPWIVIPSGQAGVSLSWEIGRKQN